MVMLAFHQISAWRLFLMPWALLGIVLIPHGSSFCPTTTTTTTTIPIHEQNTNENRIFSSTTLPATRAEPTTTTATLTSNNFPTNTTCPARSIFTNNAIQGPDPETKPDYENIHGPLGKTLDRLFLSVFRSKLAENVGVDSSLPKDDYQGLMELAAAMNARYSDRVQVQKIAQDTLRQLFPSWLPGQYAIMFSKPFPEFSARMNAWATRVGGTWLMGECEVNDVEIDGKVYKDQGLLVKRCRFLEESGCASVCVNGCKIPTQKFFVEDMGLSLTMTPDYETHECQFSFGVMPNPQEEFDAKNTPCLSRCPTAGSMRKWHDGSLSAAPETKPPITQSASSACQFMEKGEE